MTVRNIGKTNSLVVFSLLFFHYSLPYFSPLKLGLVALSAEISQRGVQSVQVNFHRSLSLYFSIRPHHSLQKMKRCILSTRIPFSQVSTSTYGVKSASGRDDNIRRGTLPVSGVYLNTFPLIICLTPGTLYAVDMTFKAFQKASDFLLSDSVFPLAL